MKTEDIRHLGDIAKAREMLHSVEWCLQTLSDPTVLKHGGKAVDYLGTTFESARQNLMNILAQLGEAEAYTRPGVRLPRRTHSGPSETPILHGGHDA